MWANTHSTSIPFMKPPYGLKSCCMKTSKRDQKVAADILTEFMFTKTMHDRQVMIGRYGHCDGLE